MPKNNQPELPFKEIVVADIFTPERIVKFTRPSEFSSVIKLTIEHRDVYLNALTLVQAAAVLETPVL